MATPAERVWQHVSCSDGDACWEWMGHRNDKGYGLIWIGPASGGCTMAHRAAWESANGPIPDGLCALHRCDNPSCCNPAHLFVGTIADNNADRDAKGRQRTRGLPGESNPNAILTEGDVVEIKARRAEGESLAVIARDFPVSKQTIWMIVRGHKWAHVSPVNDQAPRELSTAQTRGA